MATDSSIIPVESDGQRSLAGYSPWGRKEQDVTEHRHSQVAHRTLSRAEDIGTRLNH